MKKITSLMVLMFLALTSVFAQSKIYIEDFSIKTGDTTAVVVKLDSETAFSKKALQATIVLPEGLNWAETTADIAISYGMGDAKVKGDGNMMFALVNVEATEGVQDLGTVKIAAAEDFAGGVIKVTSIKVAGVAGDDTEANVTAINSAVLQAAIESVAAKVEAAQIKLTSVINEINTYADTVQSEYMPQAFVISQYIDEVLDQANAAYESGELVEMVDQILAAVGNEDDVLAAGDSDNVDAGFGVTAPTIFALINQLSADAAAAQHVYEENVAANDAAFETLAAKVEAAQIKLTAVINEINTYADTVQAEYIPQAALIGQYIDAIVEEASADYEEGVLAEVLESLLAAIGNEDDVLTGSDSEDIDAGFGVSAPSVYALINKLSADAAAAQQAYEEKIAANDAAFEAVAVKVEAAQIKLTAVINEILAYADTVQAVYMPQASEIAQYIDAIVEEATSAYEAGELAEAVESILAAIGNEDDVLAGSDSEDVDAGFGVSAPSVYALINKLSADAAAAQQAYEENVAANDAAFEAVAAKVEAAQIKLTAVINEILAYADTVQAVYMPQASEIAQYIDAIVEEATSAYEAGELAEAVESILAAIGNEDDVLTGSSSDSGDVDAGFGVTAPTVFALINQLSIEAAAAQAQYEITSIQRISNSRSNLNAIDLSGRKVAKGIVIMNNKKMFIK